MIQITAQEFVDMIEHRNGAAMAVGFNSITKATNVKTRNPFGRVLKKSRVAGIVNFAYEDAVNRQRLREDKPADFVAKRRQWGRRSGAWVLHNDKIYLTVKVQSTQEPEYLDEAHQPIHRDDLAPYFNSRGHAAAQNLEREIVTRDYDIRNITVIRMLGEEYVISHRQENPIVRDAALETQELALAAN